MGGALSIESGDMPETLDKTVKICYSLLFEHNNFLADSRMGVEPLVRDLIHYDRRDVEIG